MNKDQIKTFFDEQPDGLWWPRSTVIVKIEGKVVEHIDFNHNMVVTTKDAVFMMHKPQNWNQLQVFKFLEQPEPNVLANQLYQAALGKLVDTQQAIAYMVVIDVKDNVRYWPEELVRWATHRLQNEKRVGIQIVRDATGVNW